MTQPMTQAAWVPGLAAVRPWASRLTSLNKGSHMAQDGCTSCLWRTRLVIGQPHVPSPASAGTTTVTSSWSLTLWPQVPHLPSGSEGLEEKEGIYMGSGWVWGT